MPDEPPQASPSPCLPVVTCGRRAHTALVAPPSCRVVRRELVGLWCPYREASWWHNPSHTRVPKVSQGSVVRQLEGVKWGGLFFHMAL